MGKTAPLREPWRGSVGAFCGIIRARREIHPGFLALWFRSGDFREWRDGQARGANIQNLRFSQLADLEIPVPPLADQEQIAGRLTEQLAAVERARAAAQSNLAAAEAIPAAYLRQFTRVEHLSGELPKGWTVKPLEEVCEFLDALRRPVNETERRKRIAGKARDTLFPYYGANGQSGWIDEYLFDEPLILLAEDGGAFGSRHDPIAYTVRGRTWVNNHAHVLRPRAFMDFDFCGHALAIRPDLGAIITGATRPKLNQELAKAIPVPVASTLPPDWGPTPNRSAGRGSGSSRSGR